MRFSVGDIVVVAFAQSGDEVFEISLIRGVVAIINADIADGFALREHHRVTGSPCQKSFRLLPPRHVRIEAGAGEVGVAGLSRRRG